jgi:hypothetical protein
MAGMKEKMSSPPTAPVIGFTVKCLFPHQTLEPEIQTRTGQIRLGIPGGHEYFSKPIKVSW